MSTIPNSHAPAAGSAVPKVEGQVPATQGGPQAGNGNTPQINWDSELQLVSSLAKLQELERQVSTDIPLWPFTTQPLLCANTHYIKPPLIVSSQTNDPRSMYCASPCLMGYLSH